MKDWTWQTWVGKVILLVLSVAALVVDSFGVNIPLWMIILPAATQLAQWFLGWLPGTGWNVIVGKGLLVTVAIIEIVLAGFGVQFELWLILVPMVAALAQYLIGLQRPTPA